MKKPILKKAMNSCSNLRDSVTVIILNGYWIYSCR